MTMNDDSSTASTASGTPCRWFARCPNDADGMLPHSILGPTPACVRCADRVGVPHLLKRFIPLAAKPLPWDVT